MSTPSSRKQSTSRNSGDKNYDGLKFEDVPANPIAATKKRSKRAEEYEGKTTGLLNMAMQMCLQNENTHADAAALIHHGPAFASKLGDLADTDERVRKGLDLITSGSENPYIALTMATLPLAAQILRNHETPGPEKRTFGLKLPFTKRTLSLKLRFKLKNPFLRSMTAPPEQLKSTIFSNPAVLAALKTQMPELFEESTANGQAPA